MSRVQWMKLLLRFVLLISHSVSHSLSTLLLNKSMIAALYTTLLLITEATELLIEHVIAGQIVNEQYKVLSFHWAPSCYWPLNQPLSLNTSLLITSTELLIERVSDNLVSMSLLSKLSMNIHFITLISLLNTCWTHYPTNSPLINSLHHWIITDLFY